VTENQSVRGIEVQLHAKHGRALICLFAAELVQIGERYLVLQTASDITARKEAEEEVKYLSLHDGLTGIYNRTYFDEHLKQWDNPHYWPLSIVMGDVNGLKLVNDAFGHQKGDDLLRLVAGILSKSCRTGDVVARWAGDEFVVLLPKTSEQDAIAICARIRDTCDKMEAEPIQPSISLGAATKTDESQTTSEVLKQAENRMYRNKIVESRSLRSSFVSGLLKMLREKTFETEDHAMYMRQLAFSFGRRLMLPANQLNDLGLLSVLYDIGKIAVPDHILANTGPFSEGDLEILRKHPETGYRIALSTVELAHIADAILTHHERWDGTGYPAGLKGVQVPLIARVLAVLRTYETIAFGRPYQPARGHAVALKTVIEGAGTRFDPGLVKVFVDLMTGEDRPVM